MLYSFVPPVPGLTKQSARVQLDRHVMFAGSRRRAAAMVVSDLFLFFRFITLMSIISFTDRHRPIMKDEPESLALPAKKRKAYLITDTPAIGHIDIMGSNINPAQPSGKRHKLSSGASSQVRFDGVVLPPGLSAARVMRESMTTM